jgi:hypothetical protein
LKTKRDRINTVALASWLIGRVVKHMTKMTATVRATYFGTKHMVRGIFMEFNRTWFGVVKTRPPAVIIKFSSRIK